MMNMNKKDCIIIGLSALLASSMAISYMCMEKKMKKTKFNFNSL